MNDEHKLKAASILSNIEARNEKRLAKKQERLNEKMKILNLTNENSDTFWLEFKNLVQQYSEKSTLLNKANDKDKNKSIISEISQLITLMNDKLVHGSMYLTKYDIKQAQQMIKNSSNQLEQNKEVYLPNKKFKFSRNKKMKKKKNSKSKEADVSLNLNRPSSSNSYDINHLNNTTIIKNSQDVDVLYHDLMISNLDHCTIKIACITTAVRIDHVKNSTFIFGPVNGSIHIEYAENCIFVFASRQLRIHYCTNSKFFIYTKSKPIIEDTSNVLFTTYNLFYSTIQHDLKETNMDQPQENLYYDVQDFHWLKQQQSPNWSLMSDDVSKQYQFTL